MENILLFFIDSLQDKESDVRIEKYLSEKIGMKCVVLPKEFKDIAMLKGSDIDEKKNFNTTKFR